MGLLLLLLSVSVQAVGEKHEYVIVTSQEVMDDASWHEVVTSLKTSHPDAGLCVFKDSLRETLPYLRSSQPRYVAVVERPEKIGKQFVIELNRMSREVDKDIYEDFLAGIITGYTAAAAKRMVEDARTPFIIHNCVSTIGDMGTGKWFDSYANLQDNAPAVYRIRRAGYPQKEFVIKDSIANNMYLGWVKNRGDIYKNRPGFSVQKPNTLAVFDYLYTEFDPDLIVTASHATENNLEMPFSAGNLLCRDGRVYVDYPSGPQWLRGSNKTRVFLPVGNCLIGNINNTPNNMACAFMNSEHVSTFVGYVVTTWYGRNGWGGLRTFLTQSGRYTVAEAFYLNRQDLLYRLQENCPAVLRWRFPYDEKDNFDKMEANVNKIIQGKVPHFNEDMLGQWYDRDVVAFYGDPAWNCRLQNLPQEQDVSVTTAMKGRKCIVTIKTSEQFSQKRMEGSNMIKDNLQAQPFTYFFPERLHAPRLAKKQPWKAAVDENFLLLYDTKFEPGKTYTVVLECGK